MDKTRVVYHEDEKCKKRCIAQRRANMPMSEEQQSMFDENKAIGEMYKQKIKEAQKDMTDREFINNIIR